MDNKDLINLINNSSKLIGTRQVLKAIIYGKVTHVIIAANTDEHIKQDLVLKCTSANIPHTIAFSKQELGKLLKLKVSCAVVGII